MNYPGAGDLDGQAMTPDGSQGILVDGGNTLPFFSKVQTGTPVADTYTLDIPYAAGGNGDSVAIMPEGDEAVVSADSSKNLLLVSGIRASCAAASRHSPGGISSSSTPTVPRVHDGIRLPS